VFSDNTAGPWIPKLWTLSKPRIADEVNANTRALDICTIPQLLSYYYLEFEIEMIGLVFTLCNAN
jgi:hypothetical protein